MTSRDFCFWLQGHFELTNPQELNVRETALVKQHLALVFKHEIDPSCGSAAHQAELNAIHDAKPQAVTITPPRPRPPFGGETVRC